MGGKRASRRAPSATPWDDVPEGELTPAQSAVLSSQRSIYGFRHERSDADVAFFNGYGRDACPRCGGGSVKDGFSKSGLRHYRCSRCGAKFTPVTGTIFDNAKLPVAAWADFVLQVLSFESLSAVTREDRRSDTTPPYWMAKLFAVLDGIQDGVVLSGEVWIDETYWPVAGRDAVRRPDGRLPRGLSRNQLCIGVGIDGGGNSVFVWEGRGKTSGRKTMEAFGSRIEPGSRLVHDMELSHGALVEALALDSERHDARLLKGVPDDLNPLEPVNRLCFLLKRFLSSHSGFDRSQLQGYLDIFHVAMNPPADKLEKVAMVLDRAMRFPKTLRFRDFYNVKPRSGTDPV